MSVHDECTLEIADFDVNFSSFLCNKYGDSFVQETLH